MGKNKKLNIPREKAIPLEKQLLEGKVSKTRNKFRFRPDESGIVDSKTTGKILKSARQQQLEVELELNGGSNSMENLNFKLGDDNNHQSVAESDVTEADFIDDLQIADEDREAFERFRNPSNTMLKLSDIIAMKIQEKKTDIQEKLSDAGSIKIEEIDPKIKELYENVRDVVKRYRSGKIPKAFKIIPRLRNWEQILHITEPHNWSAATMFQATRIYSAVLSQPMSQRFYNLILLPRIRDDLSEYKKLNVHLYNSLKRALFKPAAFMKGIILPLCESGDCTLREAIIIGSIIARCSVPVLHSSACILKICEMPYTGANSIFLQYFLGKRYALPYRVVDAVVFHFLRFEYDKRELPVLWHQCLLIFVQCYKNDISSEQKQSLLELLKKKSHRAITPVIRKELQESNCRDIEMMSYVENE